MKSNTRTTRWLRLFGTRVAEKNTIIPNRTLASTILIIGILMMMVSLGSNPSSSARYQLPLSGRGYRAPNTDAAIKQFSSLPMTFEFNRGQFNKDIKFLTRGNGTEISLTSNEAIINMHRSLRASGESIVENDREGKKSLFNHHIPSPGSTDSAILKMKLVESRVPTVTDQDELSGKIDYFIGSDPSKWHTNISTFRKVLYKNVYAGIDQVFYGSDGQQLECDFVVEPRADSQRIKFSF